MTRFCVFVKFRHYFFSELLKIRPHQVNLQPRPVDVGVVHFHETVSVIIVRCETSGSDSAFGHCLHLHARKRAHGCDHLAIRVGNSVFVPVDDCARPCFPSHVPPMAADGEPPFPSFPFFDGVLNVRERIEFEDSEQTRSIGMHP